MELLSEKSCAWPVIAAVLRFPPADIFAVFSGGIVAVSALGQIARKPGFRKFVLSSVIVSAVFLSSCGGGGTPSASVNSSSGKVAGSTLYNIQASGGWKGWGELAPAYTTCSSCSPQVTWGMKQTGGPTQFDIGGTVPYSDVLWTNPVIGQGSTQGLPDNDHAMLPELKTFIYDAYFFSSNIPASQVLEFDINQFANGQSFIWGNQCRIAGGNEWDIWDNTNHDWVSTGVACNPINNAWNHVTIQVQRTSDDQLLYQSITLNGETSVLNRYYAPSSAPSGWYGITLNFQMDGDYKQTPYTVLLDKLNFTYQ